MLANTGARTRANLNPRVFPSLIKTSSCCGLSQLLKVLVEPRVEVSSGSCPGVSQHMFRTVWLGRPEGGIAHRVGPTQHFGVWQTTSVEVCHRGCVGSFCGGLFLGGNRQGDVSLSQVGVGRFGNCGCEGFFLVFYNFFSWWWGRRKARFFWWGGSLLGGFHSPLNSGLHLSVRSTSLKKKKN